QAGLELRLERREPAEGVRQKREPAELEQQALRPIGSGARQLRQAAHARGDRRGLRVDQACGLRLPQLLTLGLDAGEAVAYQVAHPAVQGAEPLGDALDASGGAAGLGGGAGWGLRG